MSAWAEMSKSEQSTVADLAKRFPDGWEQREAAKIERQLHLGAFVERHGIACFKCRSRLNDWAKTGITNGRPWAICQPCVQKKRRPPAKGTA